MGARISGRIRRYGQHFLISQQIADRIADMSGATTSDRVLEVGTGRGIMTERMCRRAGHVISIESDIQLYNNACIDLQMTNLTLMHADGFSGRPDFDVFVSNIPYSQSRRAVEWLATTPHRCGVMMVQEEFAIKLLSAGPERRAISVIWQECFEVTDSLRVRPRNFNPPPTINSKVLAFTKTHHMSRDTIQKIHALFSRRRHLHHGKRLDTMTNGEIIATACE